ncbi:endonuclease MutS2 [Helicobacter monodelphidis]|uniref:endonuclease MutS2 n=1 Tax=Helicobacter sp. 15-1451 TaxID=2004995 RepID=UPI000DCAF7AF|nr:endonuclease MutS2 [Helicobacter sp. 15-1451]RAX57688.1 endonuclease MutS2 [Helicobacter sp. 15-1451]
MKQNNKIPYYYILAKKLDLTGYLENFSHFLARIKPPHIEGDTQRHITILESLESIEFTPPPPILPLQHHLTHLKKKGFLHKIDIFEWVKLWRYFLYLKELKCEGAFKIWLDKIIFPDSILEIEKQFSDNGDFKQGIYPELDSYKAILENAKKDKQKSLYVALHQESLRPFLVDSQLHFIDDEETLLLRAGFNAVLSGEICSRSNSGFFYVIPNSLSKQRHKIQEIQQHIAHLEYRILSNLSSTLNKHLPFLGFIDRAFDYFDQLQARIHFAKNKNYEFLAPSQTQQIILHSFSHPALNNPRPISIDFSKSILLITGVNAGGKTMLLKSILSAAFLARYLLPLPLNATKSTIGHFKNIEAILDDPQDVKNDISTFAGRMLHFSQLFGAKNQYMLIGVDEIELGTDSDEAASLFKVILERLLKHKNKIILTTHHKRLAALMSKNPSLELIAALYDEKNRMPTFSFLQGTIGKSYAFETALRYNIPADIVQEARKIYGEDKEKLGELIEKSAKLELILHQKEQQLNEEIHKVQKQRELLKNEIEQQHLDYKKRIFDLEKQYFEAINLAKKAAKETEIANIHQGINNANKILQKLKYDEQNQQVEQNLQWNVGENVKTQKHKGTILAIKGNNAVVELESGLKMHIPLVDLKKNQIQKPKSTARVSLELQKKHRVGGVSLDLHGLRHDEAIEKLDEFLSNALVAGFDEVLVYHGIGTGRLSFIVKEFLKTHPKVQSFSDAPPQMGGFGAKIVKL